MGSPTYTRGDRWVIRISLLLGLHQRPARQAATVAARFVEPLGAREAANVGATKFYGEARLGATGPGSEIRKFVNVACGGKESEDLWRLAREVSSFHAMNAPGMDQEGRVHVVPAPFMVATFGRKPRLVPLGGGGVMDKVKTFPAAKAGQVAREFGDPELEMTEAEIAVALWGSHSFCRGADKQARAYCLEHGISLDLVDKVLGWREAEHARDMQLHYEESSVRKRFLEALVTWDV